MPTSHRPPNSGPPGQRPESPEMHEPLASAPYDQNFPFNTIEPELDVAESTTTTPPPTSTLLPDPNNSVWLLESASARHEMTAYLFGEFYANNFSHFDINSTDDMFRSGPIHLSAASNLPSSLFEPASSGAGSATNLASGANASGVGGATGSVEASLVPGIGGGGIGGIGGQLILGPYNGSSNAANHMPAGSRPYLGDAFLSFSSIYYPIHCVICLVICTLGIFANVTNIIVLTRPNMITAVNTILSAMAFSDLIVNIASIPYLLHELSDQTNYTSFYSFQWATYILFQAHTTVTAHTISIWLTCVLSTWRYFVVCRSQSSNQRTWSVGMAKRAIIGVFLIVPVFCIPNYLSFAIVKEVTETNSTIFKVGFSHLADESQFIKTFHYSIFSCFTKLVPCVLLTYFTTVLIKKLLSARERRLRLATYGSTIGKEMDVNNKQPIPNGHGKQLNSMNNSSSKRPDKGCLIDEANHKSSILVYSDSNRRNHSLDQNLMQPGDENGSSNWRRQSKDFDNDNIQTKAVAQRSGSSCATDGEMIVTSCESSGSGTELVPLTSAGSQQQPRILSQLIVESVTSAANSTTTIATTTKAPTGFIDSSPCDIDRHQNDRHQYTTTTTASGVVVGNSSLCPSKTDLEAPRSVSTCGGLESYGAGQSDCKSTDQQPLVQTSMTGSQDLISSHPNNSSATRSLGGRIIKSSATNPLSDNEQPRFTPDKRSSEIMLNSSRGRSMGSTTLAPFQMVKLQAAQRQITQNETTTRLLIAVMIVFLICEIPSGVLALLCAILGQDFFENVYQPMGTLTDLLALINSSVNFMIYCFMSTQFRITFYRVVLRCPAPSSVA